MAASAPSSAPSPGGVSPLMSVHHNRQSDVKEIADEADAIYRKVCAANIKEDDVDCDQQRDALLKKIQAEHPDFSASLPIALRWTVQTRQYRRAAIEAHMAYIKGKEWKDRKEFLRDQGEYLVTLHKTMNPHYDTRRVIEYRRNVVDELLKEDDEFDRIKKEAEKAVADRDVSIDQERRRKIYEQLAARP